MSSLQHRSVAGSFLFKYPPSTPPKKPLVALFRRSSKVRTYQGKLAPIAGSVEPTDPSPYRAALREIHEETSLSPPAIRLFRIGKPYSFDDDAVGRRWTINPFAFVIDAETEKSIKLDWEHDGFEWHSFDEIEKACKEEGVPNLLKSLRRVYFDIDLGPEAGNILSDGLAELKNDQVSGARELAAKALQIFSQAVQALDIADQKTWWENVRFVGWHLWKNGRESMGAAIGAVVFNALSIVEQAHQQGAGIDQTVTLLDAYAEEKKQDGLRISEHLINYISANYDKTDERVTALTLSSSSTIVSSFIQGYQGDPGFYNKLGLRILESRPLFEGVAAASRLRKEVQEDHTLHLSVYTDAAVAEAAKNLDVLLLGADLISASGAVSNKMGSLPAVLAARHVSPGAKILVVAGTDKVMPLEDADASQDKTREVEEGGEKAVTEAWGQLHNGDVAVENKTFEWVPAEFIDGYITEKGVLQRGQIQGIAKEVKAQEKRFFDSL